MRFAPVVWWGRLVEVYSAICRLHRDMEISDLDKQGAVARLALLDRGWREVLPNDQVRDLAKQFWIDTPCVRLTACSLPPP